MNASSWWTNVSPITTWTAGETIPGYRTLPAKECHGHQQAEDDDCRADEGWIHTPRDSSTSIAANDGRDKHHRGLGPPHFSRDDEQNNRGGIHESSEQSSARIHRMDVAQAGETPYREYDETDCAAKVAAVDSRKIMKDDQGFWADP